MPDTDIIIKKYTARYLSFFQPAEDIGGNDRPTGGTEEIIRETCSINGLYGSVIDTDNPDLYIPLSVDANAIDAEGNSRLHRSAQAYHYTDRAYHDYLRLIHAGTDVALVNNKHQNALLDVNFEKDQWLSIETAIYQRHTYGEKGWSFDDFATRLQSMLIAQVCGLPGDLSQKDPEKYTARYKTLNSFRDQHNQMAGQATAQETAQTTQDFLYHLGIQVLLPALLKQHRGLKRKYGDKLISKVVPDLQHSAGQVFFGADAERGKAAVSMPQIVAAARRWQINKPVIRKKAKDPTLSALDYHAQPLTPVVQAPNGLWVVPLHTTAMVEQNGDDAVNCSAGRIPEWLLEGKPICGVRTSPDTPYCTAGLQPGNGRYDICPDYGAAPLGYRNAIVDAPVTDAWNWYHSELNAGRWGDVATKIAYYKNEADILCCQIDPLTLRIGFDPLAKNGYDLAQNAWNVWAKAMDNMLRYRHDDLATMITKSGLDQRFTAIAEKHGIRPKVVKKDIAYT